MATDRQLHDLLADATVRVTHAYHLPTVVVDGEVDHDVSDWLFYSASEALDWDVEDESELVPYLQDSDQLTGWVLGVATPVPSRFSEDGSTWAFSWGHSFITAVAGPTYEDALNVAVKWAEQARERERERQQAEAS